MILLFPLFKIKIEQLTCFSPQKKSKNQHGFPTPSFVCFLFSTRLSRSAAAAVAASKGENNIIVVGLVGSEGGTIMV